MSEKFDSFCESKAQTFIESPARARGCDEGGYLYWCANRLNVWHRLDKSSLATFTETPWLRENFLLNGIGGNDQIIYTVDAHEFDANQAFLNFLSPGGSLIRSFYIPDYFPGITASFGCGGDTTSGYVCGQSDGIAQFRLLDGVLDVFRQSNGIQGGPGLGRDMDGVGGSSQLGWAVNSGWGSTFVNYIVGFIWNGIRWQQEKRLEAKDEDGVNLPSINFEGCGGKDWEVVASTAQDGEDNRFFRFDSDTGWTRAWRYMPTNEDPRDEVTGAGGEPKRPETEMSSTISRLAAVEFEVDFVTGVRGDGSVAFGDSRLIWVPSWQRYPSTSGETSRELALVRSDVALSSLQALGLTVHTGPAAINARAAALFSNPVTAAAAASVAKVTATLPH